MDFLIEKLEMKEHEKVRDLACGFGRHWLELARRGYDVTGVDITRVYIPKFGICASGSNEPHPVKRTMKYYKDYVQMHSAAVLWEPWIPYALCQKHKRTEFTVF